ncbi:MAG: Mu transposase C-terminal domain-containing protein [Gammaproteobacteria bacterium]
MTSTAPVFRPSEDTLVIHDERTARILRIPDLEHALIEYLDSGERRLVKQQELQSAETNLARANPVHVELATVSPEDIKKATQRREAIEPLLGLEDRTRAAVVQRAKEVGRSASTLYRWMDQLRSTGTLSDLLPKQVSKAKGRTKLPKLVEDIIKVVIDAYPKQFSTVEKVILEVRRRCRRIGMRPPHEGTIRNRLHRKAPSEMALKSRGRKAARDDYAPKPGRYTEATAPLSIIQIDHVLLPIQIVDINLRRAIGRPWLTLAMDVFSRVIWGMLLSLESPQTISVALCLAHGILPKDAWLEQRGIAMPWPVHGPPSVLHLDNAKEFRSDMLVLAAEEFGFDIRWRPVRVPEYGAHIERLCGTLQDDLMGLPGTSLPPGKRNEDINPEAESSMTLTELEQWLALHVVGRYHQRVHTSLGVTPLEKWQSGLLGDELGPGIGMPVRYTDPRAVLVRLLPNTKRTIQQYGIQHQGLTYWDPALIPYINHKNDENKGQRFLVRWDPRDISKIFVWLDALEDYLEVPYRNQARPSITQRQLELAQKELRAQGVPISDEDALFRVIDQQEELVQASVAKTKTARKEVARKQAAKRSLEEAPATRREPPSVANDTSPEIDYSALVPFGEEDDG